MKAILVNQTKEVYLKNVTTPNEGMTKKFEIQTKLWFNELQFLKKEMNFFSWLIFSSTKQAQQEKKEQLLQLRNQINDFEETGIEPFLEELNVFIEKARESFSTVSKSQFMEERKVFINQLEEVIAISKGLKLKAIASVDEYLSVPIF